MLSVSQTTAAGRSPRRRLVVIFAAVAGLVGVAIAPNIGGIAERVARARMRAPDLPLISSLPIAIKIHLATALTALLLGSALMMVRKGRWFHRTAGWVWVSLVALVAGSSLAITSLNPGRYSLLHLLTGWTLIILPLAVVWAKRRDVPRHRRAMMGLFYGAFALNLTIAFIPGRVLWRVFFG